MKKILTLLTLAFIVVALAGCAEQRDAAPELTGYQASVSIDPGDAYDPLDGVTASDREDGDLTSSIVVDGYEDGDNNVSGTYTIVLSVEDSAGNRVEATILLTVAGAVPTLSGINANPVYYIGAGSYSPLDGVTATDAVDGDITTDIEVLGVYDLTTAGTYTFRVRVENSTGGRATETVVLRVVDPGIPETLTTDPITITLAHANGSEIEALLNKYAASFELLYPNVDVVIEPGVGNYDTLRSNMIQAITAEAFPNIVQGYPDHVAEYLNGGVVVNLDPYVQNSTHGLTGDANFDDIIEAYRLENSQYNEAGTLYSLPYNKSTEVMIYNKTVFDKLDLDVPTTWQGLFAIADDLRAEGERLAEVEVRADNPTLSESLLAPLIADAKDLIKPAAYDSSGNMFITFTRQFGGSYTGIDFDTRSGQYLWNDDANTTAAMQFLLDNRDDITLPEFWGQNYASTPFVNQQVFVTFGSTAGTRYNIPGGISTGLGDTFTVGIAPIPYNADMPEERAVIQQGTNMSVLKSGNPDQDLASYLFLKHLINAENTADFAMATGYLPVRTSGYLSTAYQTFLSNTGNAIALAAQAAYDQSAYFFYDPAFIGSSRARAQVGLAAERIILGDGNISEALQDAYDEANLTG